MVPENEEFTPNLKAQNKSPIFWEESVPLPEYGQPKPSVGLETAKIPQTQNQQTSSQSSAFPKIVNKKFFLVIFIILILGLTLVLKSTIFSKRNLSAPRSVVPKSTPQSAAIIRRLSSAFVPVSPSSAPVDLSINWLKFKDESLGLAFSHPAEWQVVKGKDTVVYTLYYPTADNVESNFGRTVFAKLSIILTDNPEGLDLPQFLGKRYNLSDTKVKKAGEAVTLTFDNVYVLAKKAQQKVLMVEGKVADSRDFNNYLPILIATGQSLVFLK